MPGSSTAEADTEYQRLAAQVITTPALRLALLNSTVADQASHVQKILDDSVVQAHFSDRVAFVSCDEAASIEVAVACLASGLGLEPNDDGIGAILGYVMATGRTLVVLDNFHAIYSPADPEQQEATDVLLATLAAVDEVTLVITFCGSPLPECVAWTNMDDATDHTANSEPSAAKLPQDVAPPAMASFGFIRTTENDSVASVLEATEAVVLGDNLVPSPSNSTVNGSDGESSQCGERRSPSSQISTRPLTIAQSKVPPPKPTVFHGREKEVERLVAHSLAPSTAPIGIVGPGGIGKTTLALKVLHGSRVKQHYGRERFFLTCEGANSVDDILAHLASKLGVQRSQDAPLWPAVLDSLRSRQRVLLLLDNFESIWSPTNDELREASEVFLAQLAVLDEVTLLVTTRGNTLPENFTWANVDTAELDTLSSTAARLTFTDLSDLEPHVLASEPEASALTELLREIDFMPLAIKLLARLVDLPTRLLREWSEHYTAVLEADRHDGTRRELSVEVSIKISLAHLAAESVDFQPRQLLSVMGQLPAGLFPSVSANLCSTIPNLDRAAQELLRHSLVYTGGLSELRMLSPVRHYVSTCLRMCGETLAVVDKIYIDIARACPFPDRLGIDGPAYNVEIPNILSVLAASLDTRCDKELVQAVLDIGSYCEFYHHPCVQLLRKLLPILDDGGLEMAFCQLTIAAQYRLVGEPDLAIQFFERAADLHAKLQHKAGEAIAWARLSHCLRALGRNEEADQLIARAHLLLDESSELPYHNVAKRARGESDIQAEGRFREARTVHLQIGDADSVGTLSEEILKIVEKRGDKVAYIEELKLAIAIGEKTCPGSLQLATKKRWLAQQYILGYSDNLTDAEDLLIEAYATMSQHNYHLGVAEVTYVLARLRMSQCRFTEADELAEAATKLFQEHGDGASAARCNGEMDMMRKLAATQQ